MHLQFKIQFKKNNIYKTKKLIKKLLIKMNKKIKMIILILLNQDSITIN